MRSAASLLAVCLVLLSACKSLDTTDVKRAFNQVKAEFDRGTIPAEVFLLLLKNDGSPESTAIYEVLVNKDSNALLFLRDRFSNLEHLRAYLRDVFSRQLEVVYERAESFR